MALTPNREATWGVMGSNKVGAQLARAVDRLAPDGDERRDVTARGLRDALAEKLRVHPRAVSDLSIETLATAVANLNLAFDRMHQLEEEAAIDELTGVLRRGHGMLTLTREIRRAFREPDPRLVVAFIDVDRLKWFNDNVGHAEGDKLLISLTRVITKRLRSHDVVFRYGGDEFVCVLPGANLAHAEPIFESISKSFGESGPDRAFTVGLAEMRQDDTPEGLVARADEALYASRARLGHYDHSGARPQPTA
ncbi:MAG: GGDEF domain-containing protein [Chloroflexi bacterium]|nr:MAG: GGDEF domain-containing protein [Chloroflexota bacterium]TME18922.1 MAG: GGDEF domain-containing protein [Chloroflexota bacterium]